MDVEPLTGLIGATVTGIDLGAAVRAAQIDEVVPEPIGGAHADPAGAARLVDVALKRALDEAGALDSATRLERRYQKFRNMGRLGVEFVDEAG